MSLMEIIIRNASKADSELLRSIEARDGFQYPYKKTKEDYEKYIGEGDTFFIAEANGEPVGYISIVDCNYLGNVCRLHFLAVVKDFQSKGVGSRLMEHFEIEARERGYERIIINVYENNQRAIEFYKKKGYDFWFRIPYRYEEGIDAVVLYKDIGPMFVERKSKKQE